MHPAIAPIVLALCLAACAEKVPSIRLGPGTPTPDPGPSPTLGILPFQDLRPPEQHRGKKPRLLLLGIWNSRIGDYVTNENAFEGNVTDAVTVAVADAMSGGRFGQAAPLRDTSNDLPLLCAE